MSETEKPAEAATPTSTSTPKRRIFLAVNPSVASARRIGEAVDALKRPFRDAGVRALWVPPANLHVTLKFLGWIREEAVEAVRDAAREVAAAERTIEVRARGVGAFPAMTRARVLWVGLEGGEGIGRLAAALEERLGALGFEKEERPFHPHVTIARIKEGSGGPTVSRLLEPLAGKDFGPSKVGELVVYESKVTRAGSEYTAIARLPLGG